MLRTGVLNRLAAGPADALLVLAVFAFPEFIGLGSDVIRMPAAELMREFMAVLDKHRAQRRQIPLWLIVLLAAGVVSLAQPRALGLDWRERQ